MQRIIRFVREEVLAVVLIVGGVAVFIYNAVSGVLQLRDWGIPGWGWQIISAALVGAGLLVVAYRLHQRVEAAEQVLRSAPEARVVAPPRSGTTEPTTAPAPVVTPRHNAADGRIALALVDANRRKIIAEWGKVGSFELWEAASLFAEELPPTNALFPRSDAANAKLAMLKAAVHDGELPRAPLSGIDATLAKFGSISIDDHTRIRRSDLVEYAEAKCQRPAFLFPEP
ncbi:hypothetical protein [Phenylobacterium soli]|nr:hypothetical protein [Phenylobacterium soli]